MGYSIADLELEFQTQIDRGKKISMLNNSHHYFLEYVFIIAHEDFFELIVNHNGGLLTDEYYRTLKGAKIAFTKLYGFKAWEKGEKAEWSFFYEPDIRWLDEKLEN